MVTMTTTLEEAVTPTPAATALDRSVLPGPAMLTDRYELTMLSSWLADGMAGRRAVFECFGRRLPPGRRYGVVAGLGRLLPLLRDFRFDADELDHLREVGAITGACQDYLQDWRFEGDVDAYREGDCYFAGSPLLTVAGTLGDVLVETLVLSVLNFDSAIASAAARMVVAAEGRPIIDMGSRRTHEQSAVAAARAAYLAGFSSTSNVAAGYRYGIPTTGTAAHAFTMSFERERDAFASQVRALGSGTSLLVDTYDTEQGIRTAVDVAGPGLGAIRIDSGDDLGEEARKARVLLDSLGATSTRILVTSDLDEYNIAAMADAPVDGFGVGTRLVTGSRGGPNCGLVFKLVAVADSDATDAPLRPVEKRSRSKASIGGRKVAYRVLDDDGRAIEERIVLRPAPDPDETFPGRVLTVPVMRGGEVVHEPTLEQVRAFHEQVMSELPPDALEVADSTSGAHLSAAL
jgi:nicotinate phosphoribosyltransferase